LFWFVFRLMWELGLKTAQLFKRIPDLRLRLLALRQIQFHRDPAKTSVGTPGDRCDQLQITLQLHHHWRWRLRLALPLRL
jgi:hypothetical protein